MNVGVILASHGEFARAAAGTVEMVAGPLDRTRTLGLAPSMALADFERLFNDAYDELSAECDLVVVLVDILGGTPFNVVARAQAAGRPMVAFAGFSIPVLIELLICRDQWACPQDVQDALVRAGQGAFQPIAITVSTTDEAEEDL